MIGKEKNQKWVENEILQGFWREEEVRPEKIRDVRLKAKDKQMTKFEKQLEGFLKEPGSAVER